jgi:hypothetical protein
MNNVNSNENKENIENKDYKQIFIKKFRIEKLTDRKIHSFSLFLSAYLTYRFLKRTTIYNEVHGHYNSPQNLLNRRLTQHYYKDAIARFAIGLLFFNFSLFALRSYLLPNYINKRSYLLPNYINKKTTSNVDESLIMLKQNRKEGKYEFHDEYSSEEKLSDYKHSFNNADMKRRKENVKNYLENKN